MRHVSRTSAINRGLRATKSPAFGDRRRAERASASGRDGRDERASSGGRDGRDRREARVPAFDRASKGPAFGDQRRPERVKAPGRDGRDQRPERTSSFGSGGRDRRESSAPALDRGFRESKGQAFGDRRRPERASSSTRNGRDRGASRQSSFSPRMSTQSDVAPRTGPRAEEEDDRPLAFRKRDSPEPRQSTRDEKRSSSRTTDDASGEKGSYNDWLTSKRSDREKRSDGIRARQEENFARKRDQTQQQDVRSKDKKHHVRGDARTSHPSEARPRKHRDEEEDDDDDGIPDAIPYTTASSQFLYGTNPVLAALRAKRRQLYTLHLRKDADQGEALALAKTQDLKIRFHDQSRVLDKMSEDRPHNGVALEASSIPAPTVLALGKVSPDSPNVPLYLSPESSVPWSTPRPRTVLASQTTLSYPGPSRTWRQPFILFLDGITDPGNLGSIIRTAHFFGADAVAIATNTCANLNSPVLAKASAGACEAVPILAVSGPASFIHKSAEAGWRVYAAVAPEEVRAGQKQGKASSEEVSRASPLATDPVVLMLGAEGEGLRENLRNKAHVDVSIPRPQSELPNAVDVGVDSMNVGVAAGVLIDAFMRRPYALLEKSEGEDEANERAEDEAEKLF